MIVVTGAAGFIGSCMAQKLYEEGHQEIVVVDDFSRADKNKNLDNKPFVTKVDRKEFFAWLEQRHTAVQFIFHLGARTDTTETNVEIFDELNLYYTQSIWKLCTQYHIPLVYASSAATYGLGELGYLDNHDLPKTLKPLNAYGRSKNDFDVWALEQTEQPPFWAGFKFFNVYGPNEYHKSRMASVIFHAFYQIQKTGQMKLFRSHKDGIANGEQKRDFVYVKDLVNVCYFAMKKRPASGLYNLGTGTARTFIDLAKSTFAALDKTPQIDFIDTPLDIRDKYQYFTEADMRKLEETGYKDSFYTLEEGVKDYVQQYLITNKYY